MGITLKQRVTDEGLELIGRRPISYRFNDKVRNAIILILVGAAFDIIVSRLIPFSWQFRVLFYFILIAAPFFFRPKTPVVVIDKDHMRVRTGKNPWIEVNSSWKVKLARDLGKVLSGDSGLSHDTYQADWYIFLLTKKRHYLLLAFSENQKKRMDLRIFNQLWIQEMAEIIAEELGLDLVDDTGTVAVTVKKGNTDANLKEQLQSKRRKPKPFDGEIPEPVNKHFQIDRTANGFLLVERGALTNWEYVWSVVFIVFVLFFAIASPIALLLVTLFGTVYIFWNLNGFVSRNALELTPTEIKINNIGLLTTLDAEKMSMNELERIVRIGYDKEKGIEFVADSKRLPLVGRFNKKEQDALYKLILSMIVTL